MTNLDTFYPICDVCGHPISMRDGQTLGNLAITPQDVEEIDADFGLNQIRKVFARSSTMGNPETPENKVMAAIGLKSEACWHADRYQCRPDKLWWDEE